MKVSIYLSDGGQLDFDDFDPESALDMKADLVHQWLTFDMDGATVLVNRDHVVRIDVETASG